MLAITRYGASGGVQGTLPPIGPSRQILRRPVPGSPPRPPVKMSGFRSLRAPPPPRTASWRNCPSVAAAAYTHQEQPMSSSTLDRPVPPPPAASATTSRPRRARRWWAVLAAVAAMVAAVPIATTPASAESNGGVRVMPLGDSITDGFSVPGGYRIGLWQRLAAGGYRVDFVGSQFNGPASLGDHDHEGHSGWRIDQIDANIVNWLRTTTPRTVLLHIGTNDMCRTTTCRRARPAVHPDRPHHRHRTERGRVRRHDRPAGRRGQSRGPDVQRRDPRHRADRAAAGKRVHLVDMYSALTTADLADGIHPNAGGLRQDGRRLVRRAAGGARQHRGRHTSDHHASATTPPPPPTTPPAVGRLPCRLHGQRVEQRSHRVHLA